MNKRSAVLMAAGLVGSLVMGVVAFALGALGPVASPASPYIGAHRKVVAHAAVHTQKHGRGSEAGSSGSNAIAVPSAATPSAPNTVPNPSGGDGRGPESGGDPEPSTSPRPEPSESPSPPPAGGSGSDDPSASPSPSDGGDDGSGDD